MVQRSLIAKPELKSIDEGYMAVEYIGRNLRKQNKSNFAHAWGERDGCIQVSNMERLLMPIIYLPTIYHWSIHLKDLRLFPKMVPK